MKRRLASSKGLLGAALFAGALSGGLARAQDYCPPPPPAHRLLLTSVFGASYNPEGAEEMVRFGDQMLLYRSSEDLFRDNYVFVGVNPRINPTAARIGPAIEVQPLSVLNFRLNVEYVDYFGSLGTVQSFPSALSDFSSATMSRNEALGKNTGASGLRVSFSAFSQMKLGPVALRDGFTLEYVSVDLRGPDRVFFEPAYDTLLPRHGKVITNDLDLFYVVDMPSTGFFRRGFIAAGLRYTMFKPFFDSTDVRAGEDPGTSANDMHRIGPLVAFTLFDDGPSRFHEPMIVAMAQWYAAHRNRTGRDMDPAIPYGVLAFIFQSDVWTSE